jgi:hypothetical protein
LFGTWYKTALVSIFNPKNKLTAVFTGKKVVVKSCPNAANVQRASRAGCKTYSYFAHDSIGLEAAKIQNLSNRQDDVNAKQVNRFSC